MKNVLSGMMSIIMLACAFTFTACSDDDDSANVDPKIVGTWYVEDYFIDEWQITFKADGTFVESYNEKGYREREYGVYTTMGKTLTMTYTKSEEYDASTGKWETDTGTYVVTYEYDADAGKVLKLNDEDEGDTFYFYPYKP